MSRPTVRTVAITLTLALTPISGGCYSYSQVDEAGPDVGQDVRVVVSPPDGEIEQSDPRSYRGRVVQAERDTLVLELRRAAQAGALPAADRSRLVRIPADRIQRMERQEMEAATSIGLIAGGGIAAGLFLAGLSGGFTGDTEGPSGDDQDSGEAAIVVPVPFP